MTGTANTFGYSETQAAGLVQETCRTFTKIDSEGVDNVAIITCTCSGDRMVGIRSEMVKTDHGT